MAKLKIEFDLEQIREFIEDRIDEHYGKCGERYYTQYRLTEDGEIEYQNYSFSVRDIDEMWKKEDIKGEISEM